MIKLFEKTIRVFIISFCVTNKNLFAYVLIGMIDVYLLLGLTVDLSRLSEEPFTIKYAIL